MLIRDFIDRNALWNGERIAFQCEGEVLTHRAFRDAVYRAGSALSDLGLLPGDRLGILSMNSLDFLVAYGACEAFGFIAATVNFRLAGPEVAGILNDAGVRILLVEEEFLPLIDTIRSDLGSVERIIVIDGNEDNGRGDSWRALVSKGDPAGPGVSAPAADDPLYLIYTSGTTGRSKGCVLGHAAQARVSELMALMMGATSSDHALLMMPLFHVGAKAVALGMQFVGGAVTIHRRFDPAAVLDAIASDDVTITHMTPIMIRQLLDEAQRHPRDLGSLKTLIYSAAPMSPALLADALEAFGPIFLQMYGQTEGTGTFLPHAAHRANLAGRDLERLGSIGYPTYDCDVTVRDEANRPLPPGEIGELCLRGPVIMNGYWNQPEATAEALAGGWLHTGDIGRMDEDGYFYLVDRKKDMIISGGENIYSREVEDALLAHPGIVQAAVIAKADTKWGEAVCACITIRPNAALTEEAVIAHCRSRIASYKRPRHVIFLDEMPLLASGKINKPVLRAKYGGE